MRSEMPSPIGHALGGVAVAWMSDLVPGNRAWRYRTGNWLARIGGPSTIACAMLAAAPDLDVLVGQHRSVTHSLTSAVVVAVIVAMVAARIRRPIARLSLLCGGAWGSHLLLDWLGTDNYPPFGIQLLWPFSHRWFISGLNLFTQTRHEYVFTVEALRVNAGAIAFETLVLGPIVALLWLVREKALAGLAPEAAGGDHPPQERTRPILRIAEPLVQHVENGQAYVEPDEVGEG
jgi:membrane-bound metal-dependent hydrolase YbcI (DUF457 family)